MACNGSRLLAHASVESGLTAASLFTGKLYPRPGPLKHTYDRFPHFRIQCIHDTGYEQLHSDERFDVVNAHEEYCILL
jgi:hypothetical protein